MMFAIRTMVVLILLVLSPTFAFAAWTGQVTNVAKNQTTGNTDATVSFTDGTSTIVRTIPTSDPTALASFIVNFAAALTARDAAFTSFQLNTPITAPVETPAQLAADDFFQKLRTLRAVNKAVADGLLPSGGPAQTAATAAAQAAFQASYLADPRF